MRPLLFALALLIAACADAPAPEPASAEAPTTDVATAPSPSGPGRAVAQIAEVDGSGVTGSVEFVDLGDAVEVRYNLSGLTPGEHGFHLHQTGACGPDSTGTPAGVGLGRTPPVYLKRGDIVEIEVEGIGTLVTPIR